jgi:hypothetical protein
VSQPRLALSLPALGPVLPALRRPAKTSVKAFALAVCLTSFSSLLVVAGGAWIRLVIALGFAMLLVTLTLMRPALGVIATLVYLVFVAMLRRMLLPVAPWVSADPMLLVAPLVAVVLIVKAFVLDKRPFAPDAISKLVVLVLAITLAEVLNPAGGGIGAGLAGLMFMAVPLLWFFVGREYIKGPDIDRLMTALVVLGTIVAAYGLWQIEVSDPPWDALWLKTPGASSYSSLFLGGSARAFGTFSSFGEYALFVGGALAVSVSFWIRGRPIFAIPIPLLAVALFLSSGRSPLITAAFAIIVMIGLRSGRPFSALVITVAAVGIAFAGLHFGGSALSGASSGAGALVSHQLSGIADPLDPNSSTLLTHVNLVIAGVKSSLTHPLGQGTAVTNGAAGVIKQNGLQNSGLSGVQAIGEGSSATEVDISNAFVGFGIVGGVVYVLLVALILVQAVRSFFKGRVQLLAVIGFLIVDAGQWAIGGDYALSAVSWALIGIIAATAYDLATLRRRTHDPAAVAPA